MWNVCLQTLRNNRICKKLICFLRNLQTSRINNSRILKIRNAKFAGCCFYMNTNIERDFQIYVSVCIYIFFKIFFHNNQYNCKILLSLILSLWIEASLRKITLEIALKAVTVCGCIYVVSIIKKNPINVDMVFTRIQFLRLLGTWKLQEF